MITSVNRKQIFKNIHSYWLSLADSSNAFIFGIKSKTEGLIHTHRNTRPLDQRTDHLLFIELVNSGSLVPQFPTGYTVRARYSPVCAAGFVLQERNPQIMRLGAYMQQLAHLPI